MELDFIDISKDDEEGQARFSGPGAGQTSKSKAKINRSVFLDINEEQGESAVYESGGGEISAGVSPVRRKVQNPGRTVVNIDVSRPQSRERRGAEERSRAQNTPGNRGRNGENTRRTRGGNSGRKRERYSRERDEGADRERMPAKRRNPRQNAGERRRDVADARAQRERELRRRRRRRQQMAAKFTVLVFMAAFVSMLLFVFIRLVKGGPENVETVKRIESNFTEKAARREVIKSNKTPKPIIEEDFLTVNEYSRPGEKLEEVKNIFVHYTANKETSAAQNRSYFENLAITGETSASAHFIIGFDGEIVQCIPLEEIAYAVQKRNYDSVSIECCYLQADGKFTDATYQSLIRLCAWLLNEYDLAPEDMRRHYDEGGKKCPLYYVENEDAWDQFLKDLRDYIMEGKTGEV